MSTLGQKPATQHVSTEKQTITGNGGTSYTLQQSVSQASDIEVFVNNTRQEPTVAYTANNTTLTMTGAVNSSDSFYVIFQGKAIQTAGLPVDAAITASTISTSQTITSTGNITTSGTVNTPSINGGQIGGRRNNIYNGGQQIAQRNTSVTGLGADANAYQTVDRWRFLTGSTAGRYTLSQSTDAPNGFGFSTKIDVTTADTSIAAGEYFFFRQLLEGQDVQSLKKGTSDAEKVTVSFYVKGNASATYLVELEDADNSRLNSQTFDVTTSWTRVVKTFTADTTGTLDNDNANSFNLVFWLHAGSTYTGGTHTSNTWAANVAANRVPSSNTSIFDSTDREFFITGIQLEVGAQATAFEHRSFGEELALCSRYYQNSFDVGNVPGTSTAGNDSIITTSWTDGNAPFPPFNPMRSAPTVTLRPRGSTTTGSVSHGGSNKGVTPTDIGNKGVAYLLVASSPTGGQYNAFTYELDAEL